MIDVIIYNMAARINITSLTCLMFILLFEVKYVFSVAEIWQSLIYLHEISEGGSFNFKSCKYSMGAPTCTYKQMYDVLLSAAGII